MGVERPAGSSLHTAHPCPLAYAPTSQNNYGQLTDLWANDNQIESLDEVEAALKSQAGSLSCIYLRGNPCAEGQGYKLRMMHALPLLQQLDDNPVA